MRLKQTLGKLYTVEGLVSECDANELVRKAVLKVEPGCTVLDLCSEKDSFSVDLLNGFRNTSFSEKPDDPTYFLTLEKETFDTIISVNFLQKLPYPQIRNSIDWMKRRTASGGFNVIQVYEKSDREKSEPTKLKELLMKKYTDWIVGYEGCVGFCDKDQKKTQYFLQLIAKKL